MPIRPSHESARARVCVRVCVATPTFTRSVHACLASSGGRVGVRCCCHSHFKASMSAHTHSLTCSLARHVARVEGAQQRTIFGFSSWWVCCLQNGDSALTLATFHNHAEVVHTLLAAGADARVVNQVRCLAFGSCRAGVRGGWGVCAINSRVFACAQRRDSALSLAANQGCVETATMLLDAGALVDVPNMVSLPLLCAHTHTHTHT